MTDPELTFAALPIPSSQGSQATSTRPRRPPTVTPKRFTRFFTPRHSVLESRKSKRLSRASHQLRDITKNVVNRRPTSPHASEDSAAKINYTEDQLTTPRRSKRRKIAAVVDSSPIQFLSSPCNRSAAELPPLDLADDEDAATIIEGELDTLCERVKRLPVPVRRLRCHDMSMRTLQRSFGGPSVLGRGVSRDPAVDWRHSTAKFYSGPQDVHDFYGAALPFCTEACNSNSLVAVGLESGKVVVIDSSSSDGIDFSKPHVSFNAHTNAIMDMAFSSDDYLLATASGDQSARVLDMRTQQVRYVMAGHMSSVKQVRFQPGNDSVLATCSRDGSVQIWDLRCRGSTATEKIIIPTGEGTGYRTSSYSIKTVYADNCISIRDAHLNYAPAPPLRKSNSDLFTQNTVASHRRSEISITAISFLPQGREHLLLSASEANASIKVWDIRGKFSSRNKSLSSSGASPTPVSATLEPTSHARHRRFGLNSLCMSRDGARFYALCRDNAVYAYSTNHLVLGSAPELDAARSARWMRPSVGGAGQTGLGPLYGFRHPQLKVSSFYVKAALRHSALGGEEMLAVGGRDGNVVLFPTDEAELHVGRERAAQSKQLESGSDSEDDYDDDELNLPRTPARGARATQDPRPLPSRLFKDVKEGDGMVEETPMHDGRGTALVRAHHRKEVTGVAWAHGGELVSVSDDWTARCWREDGERARELRGCGEGEGRRWGCGWADVEADYDEEE